MCNFLDYCHLTDFDFDSSIMFSMCFRLSYMVVYIARLVCFKIKMSVCACFTRRISFLLTYCLLKNCSLFFLFAIHLRCGFWRLFLDIYESKFCSHDALRRCLLKLIFLCFSSRHLIRDAIFANDFLKNLEKFQVEEIVSCMYPKEYDKDNYIIKEGEIGQALFVISGIIFWVVLKEWTRERF